MSLGLCLQEAIECCRFSRTITVFALLRDSISVDGNELEAKHSLSGRGCKERHDRRRHFVSATIFVLSIPFPLVSKFPASPFFLFYLRFREGEESFPLVNFRARKRRNDAQPIKIPSGRPSSIFPARSRLTSADRIKFQPRSVAGVIVSAFTPRDGELILRFDRGNKIRTTPTSTSRVLLPLVFEEKGGRVERLTDRPPTDVSKIIGAWMDFHRD